jgi:diguanylate cyclase
MGVLEILATPVPFAGLPRAASADVVSLVLAIAAGCCCLRAARQTTGSVRRGWFAIALACWVWSASDLLWAVSVDLLGIEPGYPSALELGYLLFPVGCLLGLRWLAAGPSGLTGTRRALDGLMVGCALGLVAWVAVLDTVVDTAPGSVLVSAIALYYLLADIVLVTVVVLAVAQQRRDLVRWALLGGGVVLLAFTDHAFAYLLAGGVAAGGSLLGCGWWLGFGLIGAAALVPSRPAVPAGSNGSVLGRALWTGLLPYLPLVAAAAVTGADMIVAVEHDQVAEVLFVTLVLLVLARQFVMLRDNLALGRTVRQREAQLQHQAFHDELTGLANRALFLDRLGHALDLAGRNQRPVSVVFVDLDGFKAVNDSFGHAVGDALLIRVAERLRGALSPADTLARLGGDEFAVLVEQADQPSAVAEGLLGALQPPVHLDGHVLSVSASVGVATAEPEQIGAGHATGLLHRADVAMYAAKTSGKGRVQVHSALLDVGRRYDEPTLLRAFAAALDGGTVRTLYQPVVDLVGGGIVAFEALARWTHDGVDIPPSTFVPICARAGLSARLTATMLEQACGRLAGWSQRLGHDRLRVAVNVDPTEFSDAALPDRIEQLLVRHRLAPRQLILELTESATGNRPEVALEVMQRLRTMGVSLALDDFGTGFSTLSRLAFTPADIVKIDRAYVVDIDHDAQRRRFLAGVLELTRSLGLRTVAEGVEREGQLQELRRLGCDLVQGNHTGPARSEQDITALLLGDGSVLTPGPVGSPNGRATSPA